MAKKKKMSKDAFEKRKLVKSQLKSESAKEKTGEYQHFCKANSERILETLILKHPDFVREHFTNGSEIIDHFLASVVDSHE